MSDRVGTPDGPARPLELDPERATRPERAHYAVVDIGSNSVRLVVYDQLGRAPFPRFNEKSLCRLGEGLDRSGELSPEGFRRTVEATRRFRAIADAMGVGRIDAIATVSTEPVRGNTVAPTTPPMMTNAAAAATATASPMRRARPCRLAAA